MRSYENQSVIAFGNYAMHFKCGSYDYAVDLSEVVWIERLKHFQAMIYLQRWLRGVLYWHGHLVSVTDFLDFYKQEEQALTSSSRIIIIKESGDYYGFLISEIKQIIRYQKQLMMGDIPKLKSKQGVPLIYQSLRNCVYSPKFYQLQSEK